MTATLHVIPSANLQDIPAMLRKLADEVERGEHGEVVECAVVTSGDGLNVFGFGGADGRVAHYLLCCGARKLEEPRL
jgi:hypothetical protein